MTNNTNLRSTRRRTFVLDVPRSDYSVARKAGAVWDDSLRAHRYVGHTLPDALLAYIAPLFSLEADTQRVLARVGVDVIQPSRDVHVSDHHFTGIGAIERALEAGLPGFLLADDAEMQPRLTAALAALDNDDFRTIVVVCAQRAVARWRDFYQAIGNGGRRIIVINYDRVHNLLELPPRHAAPRRLKVRARNRALATRGIPRVTPDLLIIDDADLCSDASTNRAKFCARLIGSATFTLWVAATDANDPITLSYIAPLLAHLTQSKQRKLKKFRSCCRSRGLVSGGSSVETSDGDPADSSAPAQLAELLFEGDPCAAIRRTPTMEFQAVQADDDDFERPQMVAEPESRQQMLSRFLSAADRADLPSDSSHDGELPDWERQIIERVRRWHSAAPDGTRQRTGAGTMLFRRMSLSSLMQISDTGEIRLNSLDADSYAVSVVKPDRLDMATEDVILRLCWHGPVAALPMDVARLQAGTLYIDMRDELQPGQRRLGYLRGPIWSNLSFESPLIPALCKRGLGYPSGFAFMMRAHGGSRFCSLRVRRWLPTREDDSAVAG